ncbi:Transcription elongation factor spt4 [Neolecta irregularis DAH-3]|uniref:Transcription elongation factor SPT4 n=1 Tax=Neolecta irregularis (strain DAH-3) TaxID=1198029 RepID=A0A1U7LPP9_NEOID|nr:Transcription elongation factor spt4 [Neolecta irregularis DAH-3]|eukprot:OLL24624.1 Transcription elongation factor spt4 [Neolecta irregularis DAH-3]
MSNYKISRKNTRACYLCGIIQPYTTFQREGCPNCESILQVSTRVDDCTSATFDGTVAVLNPKDSWVCKWQRWVKCVPGIYAVKISGQFDEEIVDELERQGITYQPRDGSAQE